MGMFRERFQIPESMAKKLGVKGPYQYNSTGQYVFDGNVTNLYDVGQEIQIQMKARKVTKLNVSVQHVQGKAIVDDNPSQPTHTVELIDGKYIITKL